MVRSDVPRRRVGSSAPTEGGEQVAQLGRRDVAIALLVEVTQTLDEVVGGVGRLLLCDSLHDGQEHLEVDPVLCRDGSVLVR